MWVWVNGFNVDDVLLFCLIRENDLVVLIGFGVCGGSFGSVEGVGDLVLL